MITYMKKLATIITLVVAFIAAAAVADAKTHSKTKARSSSSTSRSKSGSTSGIRFTISNQSKFISARKYYIDEEDLPAEDVYSFEDMFLTGNLDGEAQAGSFKFIISIPKNFPSDVVKNAVLNEANAACEDRFNIESYVINGDEEEYKNLVNSKEYSYNSSATFIQKWDQILNILSQKYSIQNNDISDMLFFEAKFICNQIYEDSKYVTYHILALNADTLIGGEFGGAYFVTYDKRTGKILKFSDINFTNGKDVLKQKLQAVYKAQAKAEGHTPERISSNTWFKRLWGVALVNGGLMFQYPTYSLGPKYVCTDLIIPGKLSGK